jgi:hypothetical protein
VFENRVHGGTCANVASPMPASRGTFSVLMVMVMVRIMVRMMVRVML